MPALVFNSVVYRRWFECAPRAGPIFFRTRAVLPDFALLIGIFDIALWRDLRRGGEERGLTGAPYAWT